ncbi:MAG TPA: hypothetical protein VK566_04810 [Nitrososphaeraceae archaeon]|nr:hypothetical protein [Nitrososphaeraceae archaeon]
MDANEVKEEPSDSAMKRVMSTEASIETNLKLIVDHPTFKNERR